MKNRLIILMIAVLLVFIIASCAASQISWSIKQNSFDSFRQIAGLSSLAIGNLSPSARNPGYELFCAGLNDVPGGYCYYFTLGVPLDPSNQPSFTINDNSTETGSGK